MAGEKTGPIDQRTLNFWKALTTPSDGEGLLCRYQNHTDTNYTTSGSANEAIQFYVSLQMTNEGKDPTGQTNVVEFSERLRQAGTELARLCNRPAEVMEKRIVPTPFQLLVMIQAKYIAEANRIKEEQTNKIKASRENIVAVAIKIRAKKARLSKPLPQTDVAHWFETLVREKKINITDYELPTLLANPPSSIDAHTKEEQTLQLSEWLNTPGNVRPIGRK